MEGDERDRGDKPAKGGSAVSRLATSGYRYSQRVAAKQAVVSNNGGILWFRGHADTV